jgi:hypothetical protein
MHTVIMYLFYVIFANFKKFADKLWSESSCDHSEGTVKYAKSQVLKCG